MPVDSLRRFMLELPQVRGGWVHLDNTWQKLLECAEYPQFVRSILGEALTAAVLLATMLKHEGSLILQIRGNGPIHLLVIQVHSNGTVRGLARWGSETTETNLPALFGSEGHIAITLENTQTSERYQSIIPLEGDSLSAAIESYFVRSEQLPTRLWLTSTNTVAAGLLVQRLPQTISTYEDWQRVNILLDTVTAEELVQLNPEDLLYRLFHEESPRLFENQHIRFSCTCSMDKVEGMLRSIGEEEVNNILESQGQIGITCEFCNTHYQLDSVDVKRLFTEDALPNHPTVQ